MEKKIGIYIHIPFCIKKCAYCDFLSFPSDIETRNAYVKALLYEIKKSEMLLKDYSVQTVFFGGGTPSILRGEQISEILAALKNHASIIEDAEITIEMNPGTAAKGKLMGYRDAGINRLSIGLQSIHKEELKLLGRIHTFEEFLQTYETARECGFRNINIDLISALPKQTLHRWTAALRRVVDLEPEHISAYSLIIEEGTPFYEKYADHMEELPNEEEERNMYTETKRILKKCGYERYEISNYAKKGYVCRHNEGYWTRRDYLGLGIGAASLIEHTRFSNTADLNKYMQADWELQEIRNEIQNLSKKEEMEECLFLGLRCMKGVSKKMFNTQFGVSFSEIYGEVFKKLCMQGLLEEEGDRIRLTEKGIDVSNFVFSEFLLM